jgi:hypothetical protein
MGGGGGGGCLGMLRRARGGLRRFHENIQSGDIRVPPKLSRYAGTQFICFTSAKVQILTPEELPAG